MDFAGYWERYDFKDVWVTDECTFQLYRNKVAIWHSKKTSKPKIQCPKFVKKLMVWGALSTSGFYLKIIDGGGTIDGPKYCHIISEFIPYANALFPHGWILQQDGATPHTCRYSKKWLADNYVQVMQWPPNSADLSPIENLWNTLKNEVEKKTPTNFDDLKKKVLESQHIVTAQMRSNLMKSIRKRLRIVIAKNGEQIK